MERKISGSGLTHASTVIGAPSIAEYESDISILGQTSAGSISRAEAKAQGYRHYFTGKPCKYGHVSKRLTLNGTCMTCSLMHTKAWQKANPEKVYARIQKEKALFPERIRERQRRAYEKNAESRRARSRQYRQEHLNDPDYISKLRMSRKRNYAKTSDRRMAYSKLYYENNRDAVLQKDKDKRANRSADQVARDKARSRAYYLKNKERRIASAVAYKRSNPQMRLASEHRRRAKKRNLDGGKLTPTRIRRLLSSAKRCYLCGRRFTKKFPPTLDHVLALNTEIGSNNDANLAAACLSCNSAKRDRRVNPVSGQGILI